jgi:repressor LexA
MTKTLTKRQEEILRFIADYVDQQGYPPSIREIGKHFDIGSLRGVTVHLDALQRKGFINREVTPRSIRILSRAHSAAPKVSLLPIVGTVAAGTPVLADENIEGYVPVPEEMVRTIEGAFLLRVRGDSMIGEHIMPRDLVVIKPQETATHGDLVAVRIGDDATIKRIHFDRDCIRLMPANPAYDPIMVSSEDARIVGKIIGLLRDYEGMAF